MPSTLYHSDLFRMSPVTVTIKSGILKSKYKNQPDYIVLEIDGDEHRYNSENAECAAFFKDFRKGDQVEIEASGREAEAVIRRVGDTDSRPAPKQPNRNDSQQQDQGRNSDNRPQQQPRPAGCHSSSDAMAAARLFVAKRAVLRALCHKAAEHHCRELGIGDQESIRCFGTSLFIEAAKSAWVQDLPTTLEPKKPAAPLPPPPPPPPPKSEFDGPVDDSVPF